MTVINLNKTFVTKKELLEYINDYEIYCMYIDVNKVVMKGNMLSPLRDEEKPSFGFFVGENGDLCFKDFLLGSGDCFKFVMLKFGLSFFEAMSKIVLDAGLEEHFIIKNTFKTNILASPTSEDRAKFLKELNSNSLGKTRRPWDIRDLSYWNQYGVSKQTLLKYNVEPLAYIHVGVNKSIIKTDFYTYCYNELKDDNHSFKIYQPNNLEYKWLNNHDDSVWQGWTQLPEKGEVLIITKSLKDVMSIVDVTGIPAVSLQAESVHPKEQVMEELRQRFSCIFLLYDNDYDKDVNWGREFGRKFARKYDVVHKEIESKYKSKDFSDLVKNHGYKFAKEYLEDLISVPF
jgi:hypothetical protein